MKEALKRWLGGVAERRRPKGKLEVAADQRGRGLERRAEEESAAGLQINGDNSHDAGSGAQGSGVKAVLVGTRRGDPHGGTLPSCTFVLHLADSPSQPRYAYSTPPTPTGPRSCGCIRSSIGSTRTSGTFSDVSVSAGATSTTMGTPSFTGLHIFYMTLMRGARRYTSLGSTTNTSPNPHLKDASRPSGWKPAWELQDARFERAGR